MDAGSRAYAAALADAAYNDALEYDRRGEQELATAHLEITLALLLEIAAAPEPLFDPT